MKNVTEREKAVIFALAAGGIDDWKKAYLLSREYSTKEAEQIKSLSPTVTRWKQRPDIVETYRTAVQLLKAKEEILKEEGWRQAREEEGKEEEETGPADNNRTQKRKTARIDYSDPKAQTDKLNELINTADDPGEALDALKVIIQTQKADREAARSQKSVIYYRPVRCNQCKLYLKAGKKA